jgi:hypothetical protein
MKLSDDDRLNALLNAWTAPASSSSLERSMRDSYRRSARPNAWQWLFYGSLRVPAPLTALFLAGVLALSVFAWRRTETVASHQRAVRNASSGGYQFVTALKPRIVRRSHGNPK